MVSERGKKNKRIYCKDCENRSLSELNIFFPLNCFGRLRSSNGEISAIGYTSEHHKLVHLNNVPGARGIPQPLHRMLSQYFHESKKNPFQFFSNFNQFGCMLSHVCTLLPIGQSTAWVSVGHQIHAAHLPFHPPDWRQGPSRLVRVLITWVL